MSLSHIIAFVSGGASGLGRATVERLCRQGARVVIGDLPRAEEKAQQIIKQFPGTASFSPVDVTSEDMVKASLDLCESKYGLVNVAVSCAGRADPSKVLGKKGVHSLELFSDVIKVNTIGSFNVTRLAADRMSKRQVDGNGQRGVIINTASIAAYEGQIGQAAYSASKGAIISMTLPIARELASLGIRINVIAPGVFLTPLLESLPEKILSDMGAQIPNPKRLGKPDEFAHLVQTIIENHYINGETIRIDGAFRMPPSL